MMRCAVYLRVSTAEQDNGVALQRMLFDAEQAAKSIAGEILPDYILTDRMSGKKDDRPDYQRLIGLIESRAVDCVIFNRVDRLGRDTEMLMRLWKLFQASGVKAYACDRDRLLDWQSDDDWEYWARAAVEAEKERRRISARVRKAYGYSRHNNNAAWVCPYGYRRGRDRRYEWHPDQIDNAHRMIAIIQECRGNLAESARRIERELGIKRSRSGLELWINKVVLRGHTPQLGETVYNTHSGVLPDGGYDETLDLRLLTEGQYQEICQQMNDRARYRGRNTGKELYPLTGICWCSCGAKTTVLLSRSPKREYLYIRCRAGEERYQDYPVHRPRMIHYEVVEKTVIDYLVAHADRLIDVAAQEQRETAPNPEVLTRQQNIQELQSIVNRHGDVGGNLAAAIARLQLEITELSRVPEDNGRELRDRLCGLRDAEVWYGFNKSALRNHFTAFIEKVVIDFERREIAVSLHPSLIV